MSTHHIAPKPQAGQQWAWEPHQEEDIEAREQRQAQAHEVDHGRHNDDRSRPITVVRKNR